MPPGQRWVGGRPRGDDVAALSVAALGCQLERPMRCEPGGRRSSRFILKQSGRQGDHDPLVALDVKPPRAGERCGVSTRFFDCRIPVGLVYVKLDSPFSAPIVQRARDRRKRLSASCPSSRTMTTQSSGREPLDSTARTLFWQTWTAACDRTVAETFAPCLGRPYGCQIPPHRLSAGARPAPQRAHLSTMTVVSCGNGISSLVLTAHL